MLGLNKRRHTLLQRSSESSFPLTEGFKSLQLPRTIKLFPMGLIHRRETSLIDALSANVLSLPPMITQGYVLSGRQKARCNTDPSVA